MPMGRPWIRLLVGLFCLSSILLMCRFSTGDVPKAFNPITSYWANPAVLEDNLVVVTAVPPWRSLNEAEQRDVVLGLDAIRQHGSQRMKVLVFCTEPIPELEGSWSANPNYVIDRGYNNWRGRFLVSEMIRRAEVLFPQTRAFLLMKPTLHFRYGSLFPALDSVIAQLSIKDPPTNNGNSNININNSTTSEVRRRQQQQQQQLPPLAGRFLLIGRRYRTWERPVFNPWFRTWSDDHVLRARPLEDDGEIVYFLYSRGFWQDCSLSAYVFGGGEFEASAVDSALLQMDIEKKRKERFLADTKNLEKKIHVTKTNLEQHSQSPPSRRVLKRLDKMVAELKQKRWFLLRMDRQIIDASEAIEVLEYNMEGSGDRRIEGEGYVAEGKHGQQRLGFDALAHAYNANVTRARSNIGVRPWSAADPVEQKWASVPFVLVPPTTAVTDSSSSSSSSSSDSSSSSLSWRIVPRRELPRVSFLSSPSSSNGHSKSRRKRKTN